MIRATGLAYTYPTGTCAAVGPMDLSFDRGSRVLVTGSSGSGKSTLARLLSGLLQRHGHGTLMGHVHLGGVDPVTLAPAERVKRLAFVGQNPSDQLVAGTVGDETAFSAESAGLSPTQIQQSVADALSAVGLTVSPHRPPLHLSGGQQQRLCVAAGLAAGAPTVVLDEPLAHLDPVGALGLLDVLDRLARSGMTVVLVEHRLDVCLQWCDHLVLLGAGQKVFDGPRDEISSSALRSAQLAAPGLLSIAEAQGVSLTRLVEQLEALGLDRWGRSHCPITPATPQAACEGTALRVSHLKASRGDRVVLDDITLGLEPGERVALLGGNGVGKSTLLDKIASRAPGVMVAGRVVGVPQDPDLSLFAESVDEELEFGLLERGIAVQEAKEERDRLIRGFGLEGLGARSPHALSRGQRLRLAVAAAVAVAPDVLLLDEPTSGQDQPAVDTVLGAIETVLPGAACLVATHDVGLALRWADRVLVLHDGRIVARGVPGEVLTRLPAELPLVLPPRHGVARAIGVDVDDVAALTVKLAGEIRPLRPMEAPTHEALVSATPPPPATGLDPRLRLAGVALVGVLAVLLERPVALAALAVVASLPFFALPIGARWRWRAVAIAAGIVWPTVMSQGLFYSDVPRVALVSWGPLAFYREGVIHGLVQSLRLISVSFAGLAVAISTPPDRLFAALLRLRVPYAMAFLAVTALRFVPIIGRELLVSRRARTHRGRPAHRRSVWAWLVLEVSALRPVVARSLRRAQALAESLDCRGFDAASPRAIRTPLRFRAWEWVMLTGGFILLAGAVFLRGVYWLYLNEVWYEPSWRGLYGAVRNWM